jgi:hypothetical protein
LDTFKHLNRIFPRCFPSERNRVNHGSSYAISVRLALEFLSTTFKFEPVGTEVESGYVDGLVPTSPDLDYAVVHNGKIIAQFDVTGSPTYTFAASKFIPLNIYKGKKVKTLLVPTYFVFWLMKEGGAIKDCCYWIKGEDVIKYPTRWLNTFDPSSGEYKLQENYITDKKDWYKGLDSMIRELEKVAHYSVDAA